MNQDIFCVSRTVNFRLSGLDITLIPDDPDGELLFHSTYKGFIRACRKPDLRIRVSRAPFPEVNLSRANFLAQVEGWWSFYRAPGKKLFLLPRVTLMPTESAVVRRKLSAFTRRPRILRSSEPSDFNSRNTLLPLPERLAIFNNDFRTGTIYVANPPGERAIRNPIEYPLLHLVLSESLLLCGGILLHACGVVRRDGRCYLFLGRSGDGKSTMARLWKDHAYILDDDRVPIRRKGNEFHAYPLPGCRENPCTFEAGRSAPIDGIFFLRKGRENKVERLNTIQSLSSIIAYTPAAAWDADAFRKNVDFLKRMSSRVPCHLLTFVPDESVVKLLLKHARHAG